MLEYKFRATWTSHLGQHAVTADSIKEVMHLIEGFTYPKPDLKIERCTVVTSPWEEVS